MLFIKNKNMENFENEKVVYAITEGMIQQEAENLLDRKLSPKEIEEIEDEIMDSFEIPCFIQDCIGNIVEDNNMAERSKDADKIFPHYRVMWKNENAFQKDFKTTGYFQNKEDAKRYVDRNCYDLVNEQYKIFMVDKNNETEIEIIGKGEELA